MTTAQNEKLTVQKPLRVWPGVVIVLLDLLLRYVVPIFVPEAQFIGVIGILVGAVGIFIWWLFFSRALWSDRVGGLILMVVALFVTKQIVHESIAKGAMGFLFFIVAVPTLYTAFVLGAVVSRNLSQGPRRAVMVVAILIGCGVWTLIRTGGFTGDFDQDLAWRWSETPEERLLAEAQKEPEPPAVSPPAKTPEVPVTPQVVEKPAEVPTVATEPVAPVQVKAEPEWPGFRGPKRDGIVRGVRIATDWSASPPVELWRRKIGPGWSSFAVSGNLIYTQEQRGDFEEVACYDRKSGKPVWKHRDAARFWESNAGPGPRGTPTLYNGRVYALGATGILNALNAEDGKEIWSRNAATDTGTEIPGWGFSSSPVVVDDVVIVATAGQLIGYDIDTGNKRWMGPEGGEDYSSPHLTRIDGIPQILFTSAKPGAISVTPATGKVLWRHSLPTGTRIVQPAMTSDGDILLSDGTSRGLRRLAVEQGSNGWTVKERWTSNGLKPYFSDFVVHDGHAFGFDGSFLSCIDLKNGEKKWKGGRYGSGQLILLADQDLLLVLSEKGELALVRATTDQFTELARVPAIEGKTWNHPVMVGNTLLVRNGEEMAAFRLALAK